MTLYKPTYTSGWNVVQLDLESCRKLGTNTILHRGTCYSNNFYTTEQAALDYISKNYHRCKPYKYEF